MLAEMGRQVAVVLYVVAMVAVIVGVDFAFFRNRFWERLTVNIGIVLVFVAFYVRFLGRPWTRRDSALSLRFEQPSAIRPLSIILQIGKLGGP
jgi:hypothetical protein